MNDPPDPPPSSLPAPVMIISTPLHHPPALVSPCFSFKALKSGTLPPSSRYGILGSPLPVRVVSVRCLALPPAEGVCPVASPCQFRQGMGLLILPIFSHPLQTRLFVHHWLLQSGSCSDLDFGCCSYHDSGSQHISSLLRRHFMSLSTVHSTVLSICFVIPAKVCLLDFTPGLLSEFAVLCLSSSEVRWICVAILDVNF